MTTRSTTLRMTGTVGCEIAAHGHDLVGDLIGDDPRDVWFREALGDPRREHFFVEEGTGGVDRDRSAHDPDDEEDSTCDCGHTSKAIHYGGALPLQGC